ncbi:MAG: hypothetical protein KDK25_12255 [Leptospiraceae bacterium]|nr:hypothetical protein [Leptospiraceae bacterium]
MAGTPFLLLAAIILCPRPAFAWWEHTLLTLAATRNLELPDQRVPVESLEDFLKEGPALRQALIEMDAAFASIPAYPPISASLQFDPGAADLRQSFLQAIRINPDTRLLPYIQYPTRAPAGCRAVDYHRITFLKDVDYLKGVPFCAIRPGQMVSARDVLVSASDEPDYGHDIGLFEDNDTEAGSEYGFGIQPFGNPNLEYSSQAPFHMGFYHESGLVYALAGFLKQTYAQYRALQYLELARFAFRTGHDYWGYRFLGWGLHYVQDLTQPYHATVMPSRSSAGMIWINVLNTIGISGPQTGAVQLLSNRHLALENYQRNLMLDLYKHEFSDTEKDHSAGNRDGSEGNNGNPDAGNAPTRGYSPKQIMDALSNMTNDSDYDFRKPGYIREIVAGEAAKEAPDLDEMLSEALPEPVAHDPEHIYEGVEESDNMYRILKEKQKSAALAEKLLPLFRSVGIHTRNYIRLGTTE